MLYFDKNSQGDKYKVWNNWADSSPTKGNFNVIELINTATKKKKKKYSYRMYKWGVLYKIWEVILLHKSKSSASSTKIVCPANGR